MPKGCIIYCIEQGILEHQTLLSIASIRRYGGKLNQFDLFCLQPRRHFPISQKTISALKDLDVTLIQKTLNTMHPYYALANKPMVCDFIIKNYSYDRYVFLDCDTIVFNEPAELLSTIGDIGICPVAQRGIGVTNFEGLNGAYWSKLLDYAQVELNKLHYVETALAREKIIAYWNTGVISFDGQSNICEAWSSLVHQVLDQKLYKDPGIFFVEQTCLSALLLSGRYEVNQMSLNTNFPFTKKITQYVDAINLDEILILHHYNNLHLMMEDRVSIIGKEKEAWLREQLARLGFFPQHFTDWFVRAVQRAKMQLIEKFYFFVYRIKSN